MASVAYVGLACLSVILYARAFVMTSRSHGRQSLVIWTFDAKQARDCRFGCLPLVNPVMLFVRVLVIRISNALAEANTGIDPCTSIIASGAMIFA